MYEFYEFLRRLISFREPAQGCPLFRQKPERPQADLLKKINTRPNDPNPDAVKQPEICTAEYSYEQPVGGKGPILPPRLKPMSSPSDHTKSSRALLLRKVHWKSVLDALRLALARQSTGPFLVPEVSRQNYAARQFSPPPAASTLPWETSGTAKHCRTRGFSLLPKKTGWMFRLKSKALLGSLRRFGKSSTKSGPKGLKNRRRWLLGYSLPELPR
jgi:hypothetical protein